MEKIQRFHNIPFGSIENVVSSYEIQIYKESAEHHPRMASQYALAINRQVPEFESIIAKDGRASVEYAIHVLNGRFELGELTIQHNPEFCAKYIEFLKIKYPINNQNKASSVLENIITSDRLL